jgi:hypothetical protein
VAKADGQVALVEHKISLSPKPDICAFMSYEGNLPMRIFRDSPMRVFIAACIAAAVIAVCAVVVLDRVQKPADAAYTTEAVRNR